jgi:hypothetical protein
MCFISDCLVRKRIEEIIEFNEDKIGALLKEYKSNLDIEKLIESIQ